MKKIGLTGGFGTGKSTVGWMFEELGIPVINADDLAHKTFEPHSKVWKQLFNRYGKEILLDDQIINRKKLAEIIFIDQKERKFVESIIHPHVHEEFQKIFADLAKKKTPLVIAEIPLLFEAKKDKEMDHIIVVICDYEIQINRCMKKFDMTRKEVIQRITSQKPIKDKESKADFVIDNSATKEKTLLQVQRIYKKLL